MKNRHVTQLNKAYYKIFKQLNKTMFQSEAFGLLFFIEYLRYLRDYLIISTTENLNNSASKEKIATLVTAIAEFESYEKNQDIVKKAFHRNNFCEFVRLNMEEWLKLNDSV